MYVAIVMSLILLACRQSSGFRFPLSLPTKARSTSRAVRPTLDDVERISRGQAAKRRGTGSRAVPHRLNSLERSQWDIAKKKRYLVLRGTGWRRERGDSPLANIYRQFCDSMGVQAVNICQGLGVEEVLEDTVVIDFSPLRSLDYRLIVEKCLHEVNNGGYTSTSEIIDATDTSSFEGLEDSFAEEAIFRIPVLSLSISFRDRAEAKKYAEFVAINFALSKSTQDV